MTEVIRTSRDFDAKEIYKVTHSKSTSCKDAVGEIYKVLDFILYKQDDAKGVMREVLALFTENGNVSTVSETFKKSFFDIYDNFGLPVEIVITNGVSKSDRTYVSCELV